jgi:ADP-ribose pyrophosphatase YjhB (NUDIX family)
MDLVARDRVEYQFEDAGQNWLISWWPADQVPSGKWHGSGAICLSESEEIVIISQDGKKWELPAGRPEGDEDWRATLDREMLEEACAIVDDATLLGFAQGRCISGHEKGLVLVRSYWVARVTIQEWRPEYEVLYRSLVAKNAVMESLDFPAGLEPIYARWILEAGIV